MASSSISWYTFTFSFLVLFFATLSADQPPSFGFQTFSKDSNFESQLALYGDAKVDSGGSFVQITGSRSMSTGRLMYKRPIKLVEGDPRKQMSFGTYFSFSLSAQVGVGLAFVMLPNGFASNGYDGSSFGLSYGLGQGKIRGFAVEFDTKIDAKYGDPNGNHVGIDVGSLVSVKVTNVSKTKLVLNSGEKLQCWIDYEPSSKRVEVRLSKLGAERPIVPLVSCPIDLLEIFKDEELFFGLSASNANSTQICNVYSWSFKLRRFPYWMHSQPLDPDLLSKDAKPVIMQRRSDCTLRVLTALIFGTGCGALGAFLVLLVWTMLANRQPVMPEEFVVHPVKCDYDYDKVKVLVMDEAMKDGGKQMSKV
ncbi:hypothetical protein Ancab_032168 [Ancistrocladus abbreviatus]